jgi:hypothetical protein
MRGPVGMLALVGLLCAVGAARADVTVAPCPGDCGLDRVVGIAELVKAVETALDGAREAECGADLDGDGAVTIDELIRLVGLALTGCPPLLEGGVYDIDARGQSDPSGGFNKSGAIVVDPAHGGVSGRLHFSPLESYDLTFAALPDGSLSLDGNGFIEGDIAVGITGHARLTTHDEVLELRGVLDVDTFLGGGQLDFVAHRPRAGTASAYSGTYQMSLQHPQSSASRFELSVEVPPSGIATCGATQDRSLDGTVLAELPAVTCLVSPSGWFRYVTPYAVPVPPVVPLQVWGALSADPGVVTRGSYYIALFPTIYDSGAWQAQHLAP